MNARNQVRSKCVGVVKMFAVFFGIFQYIHNNIR